MAKLTWKVSNGATDLTSLVRSLDYTFGRQNAVSAYAPNYLSFTMTNTNNGASLPAVQDVITVSVKGTGAFSTAFTGRVTQRNFNDGSGTALNSTCTIVLADSLEPLGTLNNTNFSTSGFDLLDVLSASSYYGSLTGSTDRRMSTPSGQNGLTLANNIIAGDGGVVSHDLYYAPQSGFPSVINTSVTFGPSISATQIGYQTFIRVEGSSNGTFFTSASVTDTNTTTSANAANVLYYGQRYLTVTSQEQTTSSNASWYANVFSDPTETTLEFSWTDTAQNSAALDLSVTKVFAGDFFSSVNYTPPGGVSESAYYWAEQITVSATVHQTTVSMIMTPASQYGKFILNSTVFGVLDTSRLGVS